METISLNDDQRERAVRLLERLAEGEIQHPTDVFDSWALPEDSVNHQQKDEPFPTGRKFVDPSGIEGPGHDLHRLKPGRLAKVLQWLIEGEYQVKHSVPPIVEKREDRYYVIQDGRHRCIAARAIGFDELYVEFQTVPPHLLE